MFKPQFCIFLQWDIQISYVCKTLSTRRNTKAGLRYTKITLTGRMRRAANHTHGLWRHGTCVKLQEMS